MKNLLCKKLIYLLAFFMLGVFSAYARKPIKTLVVTGQNNHNWPVSHVAIDKILSNSGLFRVQFAISPKSGADMSSFNPDFSAYDLVVLDYNGDLWPEKTQKDFVEYVKNGGGVVIYHAANNSFTEWKEYNKIIALGGWGGRTEKDGPYVYWENNQLKRDMSPGNGGSHGKQHEFVLHLRNHDHPIVKGLPDQWKHGRDELYDRMRGPGNIKSLLYTAYAPKEMNGSGREEPLIFTVDYEKGRIFHIMLGHVGPTLEDNPSMQCTGFQVLFLRGSEWAATGKVTQQVPDDFPTAEKVTYRKNYKK